MTSPTQYATSRSDRQCPRGAEATTLAFPFRDLVVKALDKRKFICYNLIVKYRTKGGDPYDKTEFASDVIFVACSLVIAGFYLRDTAHPRGCVFLFISLPHPKGCVFVLVKVSGEKSRNGKFYRTKGDRYEHTKTEKTKRKRGCP